MKGVFDMEFFSSLAQFGLMLAQMILGFTHDGREANIIGRVIEAVFSDTTV